MNKDTSRLTGPAGGEFNSAERRIIALRLAISQLPDEILISLLRISLFTAHFHFGVLPPVTKAGKVRWKALQLTAL